MLPEVAPPAQIGRVSGLAWGLGYAGGQACLEIALLQLVQPDPALFGLERGSSEHGRAGALVVAAWTLVFGWPVLLMVPDSPGQRLPMAQAVTTCVAETHVLLRGLPKRQIGRASCRERVL